MVCSLLFGMILIAGVVSVFTFSTGLFHYDMWDYYEGVMWADATLQAGSPVNPDYIYFYLLPFGSNIIMAPLVALLGKTVLANQLGMLLYLALYFWLALRLADALFPADRRSILIFVSVLSLFFFTYMGENLLHHLLAYGIAFVCLLGELSSVIRAVNGRGTVSDTAMLIILSLWSGLNGFSAALCTVPLVAAYVLIRIRDRSVFKKDSIKMILLTSLPCLAGLFVFMYFNTVAISRGMYHQRLIFDTVDNIVKNLTQDLIADYLGCFYFVTGYEPLFSKRGIFLLVKLAFAIASVLIPICLLVKQKKEEGEERDDNRELLFLSCFFVTMVCMAQYVIMESSVLRYLFNAILCLFMIFAYVLTKHIKKEGDAVALLLLVCFVFMMTLKWVCYNFPEGQEERSKIEVISDTILDEGLSIGYICDRYWKVIDLTSKGRCYNTTVSVNRENKTISIEKDRIFTYELEKPRDVDKFYIVTEMYTFEDDKDILAGWSKQIAVSDVYVLIYDIDCWDSLFV